MLAQRKKVVIKLTDEQREEIKTALGKEVTYIILQLVGGSQLILDASDALVTPDDR